MKSVDGNDSDDHEGEPGVAAGVSREAAEQASELSLGPTGGSFQYQKRLLIFVFVIAVILIGFGNYLLSTIKLENKSSTRNNAIEKKTHSGVSPVESDDASNRVAPNKVAQ